MTPRSTIKDVAQQAGVSVATVSLVIKGQTDRYTPETAQRVQAAIQKLKYRPNRIARNLQRRQSRTLGFVTHKDYALLTRSQWFSGVLDGVLELAQERDYDVKLSPIASDNTTPERKLEDGSMDGVILAAPAEDSALMKWAADENLPCVVTGRVNPKESIAGVGIDDFAAELEAARYFVKQGHRRIAFLGSVWILWSARQRELAYEQAMREAGLEAPPELRFHGRFIEQSGEQGAREMLKLKSRPTAFLCASDEIAIGALRALQQAGVRVPQDIQIIGFDDELKVQLSNPPLSTVRQPVSEIGRAAAGLLLDMIEGRPISSRHITLPTELILRGSTALPR
jgi:DNA-binding LacI/PurR family transcriptional regulator